MKTRKTWGVVNKETNCLTLLFNHQSLCFFRTPAIFRTKKLALNYIKYCSVYAPAFPNMVRVERIVIKNAH